jgi:hypothetical protein
VLVWPGLSAYLVGVVAATRMAVAGLAPSDDGS